MNRGGYHYSDEQGRISRGLVLHSWRKQHSEVSVDADEWFGWTTVSIPKTLESSGISDVGFLVCLLSGMNDVKE